MNYQKELEIIINGWFEIDDRLLFVVQFDRPFPHLLSVLDNYGSSEKFPFEIEVVGGIVKVCEWRFDTFYLYMIGYYEWPFHWPEPKTISNTYYRGKTK